jgi:hypothetical protein
VELLREVLRDEVRRSRRRVWLGADGRYRPVVDRFEDGIVEALTRL